MVIFYDICAILLVVDKVLILFLCLLITVFSQITINNVSNSYSYVVFIRLTKLYKKVDEK